MQRVGVLVRSTWALLHLIVYEADREPWGAQGSGAAPRMLQQPSPCICIARLLRWPAQHQQQLVYAAC